MREFPYKKIYQSLLTPDIVALAVQIHEYKGEQNLFIESTRDTPTHLLDIAKIQSIEASNRIEGIFTSDYRLKKIVREKSMPGTRNEKEIAGYRDVLATIHENHDFTPPIASMFLQFHRDLYKFCGKSMGGTYKSTDNRIEEVDAQGIAFLRFEPVSAGETPEAMGKISAALADIGKSTEYDLLLLIPVFILDFLCIHPFNDGNGRMSRLITLLLLYRSDYNIGKYISIEKVIEASKETYYEALQQSSEGWHEEKNDYLPFVRYMLGVIVAAYREFSSRIQYMTTGDLSKPDRVRETIKATIGQITKTELMQKYPDISQVTIQRTLNDLLNSSKIIKIGGGRYTKYIWNREKE